MLLRERLRGMQAVTFLPIELESCTRSFMEQEQVIFMKTPTTPQAPCTPNWMQNAPAASALNDDGIIHKGMKAIG